MKYTKKQLLMRTTTVKRMYWEGRLSPKEIAQYESLPDWEWRSFVFMPFKKARTLARAQHFVNFLEFITWTKPEGMPSSPSRIYKDTGWLGNGDFLGTGNKLYKEFVPFTKARSLARSKHFTNSEEFKAWPKPEGIPSNPNRTYIESGWINWADFLGTANMHKKVFLSFAKARALTRAQHFTNTKGFWVWRKPEGVPSAPDVIYADSGWISWGDFLGTGNTSNSDKTFMSFTKARTLVRSKHFVNIIAFQGWHKPTGMPSNPNKAYKGLGWLGNGDFLGTTKKGGKA